MIEGPAGCSADGHTLTDAQTEDGSSTHPLSSLVVVPSVTAGITAEQRLPATGMIQRLSAVFTDVFHWYSLDHPAVLISQAERSDRAWIHVQFIGNSLVSPALLAELLDRFLFV